MWIIWEWFLCKKCATSFFLRFLKCSTNTQICSKTTILSGRATNFVQPNRGGLQKGWFSHQPLASFIRVTGPSTVVLENLLVVLTYLFLNILTWLPLNCKYITSCHWTLSNISSHPLWLFPFTPLRLEKCLSVPRKRKDVSKKTDLHARNCCRLNF